MAATTATPNVMTYPPASQVERRQPPSASLYHGDPNHGQGKLSRLSDAVRHLLPSSAPLGQARRSRPRSRSMGMTIATTTAQPSAAVAGGSILAMISQAIPSVHAKPRRVTA